MSKNYAKLSPRNEQRYRKNSHSSKSGYFILLLLVIIGITGYYVFSRGIFFSKNPNEVNHQPAKTQEMPPKPAKPRFEFYTLLSKETVPVQKNSTNQAVTADATTSEEQAKLATAKAKEAEIAAKQLAEEKAAQSTTSDIAPTGVPAIPVQTKHNRIAPSIVTPQNESGTREINTVARSTVRTVTSTAKPIPVPPPVVTPSLSTNLKLNRYLLQVAALQRMSDVDQLKAKLSFLGFNVSVEPFQRSGIFWYRIKVGPYLSQEAMQKARQVLANNRLSSIVITLPPAK